MTTSNQLQTRRTFTHEFKFQLVALYENDKRKCDIICKNDITITIRLMD